MLSTGENDLLRRVEGDTSRGQIMRRHPLPSRLSEEVADHDGAAASARLLGEDLVALRASGGRRVVVHEIEDWRRLGVTPEELGECPVVRTAE